MRKVVLAALGSSWLSVAGAWAQEIRTLEHQDVARSFMIANQAAAADGPKPAVIALHGLRRPPRPISSFPLLDALATREGFVAVYPAALDGSWNYVAQNVHLSRAGTEIADDVGFLSKLIDTLIAEKIADPSRVYVYGVSQGGFLAYSVLCELSHKVAAVAPLLASMTEAQISLCKPARAAPAAVIAGTHDAIVLYDGWLDPAYRLTSVPETLEFWRKHHGCTGQKSATVPRRDEASPTRVWLFEWTGCRTDGALRLYRVLGGGHTVPSATPQTPEDQKRFGIRNQGLRNHRRAVELLQAVFDVGGTDYSAVRRHRNS